MQSLRRFLNALPLHKKWSFPLRISSVNVTKSARNWGFGHITEEILNGKLFCAVCSKLYGNCADPQNLHTRILAVFSMIVCNGALWDTSYCPRKYQLKSRVILTQIVLEALELILNKEISTKSTILCIIVTMSPIHFIGIIAPMVWPIKLVQKLKKVH